MSSKWLRATTTRLGLASIFPLAAVSLRLTPATDARLLQSKGVACGEAVPCSSRAVLQNHKSRKPCRRRMATLLCWAFYPGLSPDSPLPTLEGDNPNTASYSVQGLSRGSR